MIWQDLVSFMPAYNTFVSHHHLYQSAFIYTNTQWYNFWAGRVFPKVNEQESHFSYEFLGCLHEVGEVTVERARWEKIFLLPHLRDVSPSEGLPFTSFIRVCKVFYMGMQRHAGSDGGPEKKSYWCLSVQGDRPVLFSPVLTAFIVGI